MDAITKALQRKGGIDEFSQEKPDLVKNLVKAESEVEE